MSDSTSMATILSASTSFESKLRRGEASTWEKLTGNWGEAFFHMENWWETITYPKPKRKRKIIFTLEIFFYEKTGTQARQSHRSCCRWKVSDTFDPKKLHDSLPPHKKLALNSFLGAQATSSWTDLGGDSHEIWRHVISHLNHIQNSTHGICWQLISRDFILPILYLNQGPSPSFFRKQPDCYLVSIKQQCYCSRAIMVHDGYRKFHSSKFQNAVNIAPIIPYWRTNNNNSFDKS